MRADPGEKYEDWVRVARGLIQGHVHPDSVQWQSADSGIAADLFAEVPATSDTPARVAATLIVPRVYRETAALVYHHRDTLRFDLIYRLLWRLQNGEPQLMHYLTDPDIERFFRMAGAVRRDTHKAKAFVRFRKTQIDNVEWYVAWHRSDHYILPLVAPFFQNRFRVMNWSIITPDSSVHWDGEQLTFQNGLPHSPAATDDIEEVWRTYYASIFNPARLKIKAMKTEMPLRYWKTLPEAELIPSLIANSEERMAKMIAEPQATARDYLPEKITLPAMRSAETFSKSLFSNCRA